MVRRLPGAKPVIITDRTTGPALATSRIWPSCISAHSDAAYGQQGAFTSKPAVETRRVVEIHTERCAIRSTVSTFARAVAARCRRQERADGLRANGRRRLRGGRSRR